MSTSFVLAQFLNQMTFVCVFCSKNVEYSDDEEMKDSQDIFAGESSGKWQIVALVSIFA